MSLTNWTIRFLHSEEEKEMTIPFEMKPTIELALTEARNLCFPNTTIPQTNVNEPIVDFFERTYGLKIISIDS